jgi:uncharacterized RDD family membrane protein YckC
VTAASTPATGELEPGTDPTAVLGPRIGAAVVDLLIIFVVQLPGAVLSGYIGVTAAIVRGEPVDPQRLSSSLTALLLGSFAVGLAVSFLLDAVLVALRGRTPGMMLCKVRVVRTDGTAPGWGAAIVRWLLWFPLVAFCGLLWPIVELIVCAVTRAHRRVGDFAAGTLVVGERFAAVAIPADWFTTGLGTTGAQTAWPPAVVPPYLSSAPPPVPPPASPPGGSPPPDA